MDKYSRVEKPKPESPISENEIRITTQGLNRNYLSYATTLLQEKQAKEIVLKAMGQAISKTVAISESIKRRIPGLHQDIAISSITITDVWEPNEEGLVQLETTRQVSIISITLSTAELNKNSPGYQAPTPNEQQPRQRNHYQQFQPRHGQGMSNAVYDDSYGRGRGRGRVRGRGRGRGRGHSWGSGGYETYQDDGGYSTRGQDLGSGYETSQGGGYSTRGRGGGLGRGRGRGWGNQDDGYQGGNYQGGRFQRGNYQGGRFQRVNYRRGGRFHGGNYEEDEYQGGRYHGGGRHQGGNYQGDEYHGGRYHGGGRYQGGRYHGGDYQGEEYEEGNYQDGGYQGYRGGRGFGRGPRGRGRGGMGGRSRGGANQA